MSVTDWLLEGDPAIRWQVLRDLVDAPAEEVAAERARVATEGWGAQLLAARDADGLWAGGACFPAGHVDQPEAERGPGQPWTSTLPSLDLLRQFGLDPDSAVLREAVEQIRDRCRWEHENQPFFDGEVEACINGRTLAIGAYVRTPVEPIVVTLLADQLADGGWNCWAEYGAKVSSADSTLCAVDGLLAWEQSTGGTAESMAARRRGEEYLLERGLFRRKSTGEVAKPDWLRFSFPPHWHYDVLKALDYFRCTSDQPDPRLGEAVDLVRTKQQSDGTWLLEHTHPGAVHLPLDDGDGRPSRWNTLRALRVLRWYDRSPAGGSGGGEARRH